METASNLRLPDEAGDWKHGFQLPASEMIDMKARPGASFNPNPERRGGLSLLKRSSCQDPRQNRVKSHIVMWMQPGKCFVSSLTGPTGPVPKCPAAAVRRQAVPVPSPGPLVCNQGRRLISNQSQSNSRADVCDGGIVIRWEEYPCSSLLWN